MIVLSPDALTDVERLRTFLDQANPGAARRGAWTRVWDWGAVFARSEATKQSNCLSCCSMDCFASLAMTAGAMDC
jgi:hypothetical protein